MVQQKMTKSKNTNLHQAKSAKNDEFYTKLEDIENELKHYKEHFKDKIVYCNCDDYTFSKFFTYFTLNFERLGLKKLITTGYNENGKGIYAEYNGDLNSNLEVDKDEIIHKELEEDGDFRSDECIDLLKQADIIVTNPPFSMFREYVAKLMKFKKKFLIIGNKNAITFKEIFPLLKENKMWIGVNMVKEFITPNGETQKFGNIGWFTNLSHSKRNEKLTLYKKYDPVEYPKYDNYFGWNVNKVSEIPIDDEIVVELTEEEFKQLNNTNYEWELLEEYEE